VRALGVALGSAFAPRSGAAGTAEASALGVVAVAGSRVSAGRTRASDGGALALIELGGTAATGARLQSTTAAAPPAQISTSPSVARLVRIRVGSGRWRVLDSDARS
jgi:hypothetical protein